jgi:AraC-like DNA-binding protein
LRKVRPWLDNVHMKVKYSVGDLSAFPTRDASQADNRPSTRQRVLAALDELYADPETTAELIGLSAGVSGRRVKAILAEKNTTLRAQLLDRRMARARELLAGGTFAIRNVAYLCGYRCPSTFAKRFAEQHHGISPRRYRAAKGGSLRTGGPTGAFRKPAERARALERGEDPPSMSPWRSLGGSWEVIYAESGNRRRREELRGEKPADPFEEFLGPDLEPDNVDLYFSLLW